jgi:hypothetical protein
MVGVGAADLFRDGRPRTLIRLFIFAENNNNREFFPRLNGVQLDRIAKKRLFQQ